MRCQNCNRDYFDSYQSKHCRECRKRSKNELEKIKLNVRIGNTCVNGEKIKELINNGFDNAQIARMVHSSRTTIAFFRKQIQEAYNRKNETKKI